MLGFAAFALLVTVLFGGYALLFTYVVEDRFFSNALQSEAAVQRAHHARTGRWTSPRSEYIRLHESAASFPTDLHERFRSAPTHSEFAGESGRHYHLLRLSPAAGGPAKAFLVAEVSQQLVVRRMREDILQLLAWSALAVLAVALLAGYWLARRVSAPLAALAQRVETMQPNDPPAAFARQFPGHEVGLLAQGLEALSARVRAFIEREQEFTRDASHELRTPLTVIHSACERLAQEPSLSPEAQRQIDFLRQSVWQLQQTVSTLLSLAREENVAALAEAVPVLPVLEQVVLEQAILLDGKRVDVSVTVPADARMTLPPAVLRILLGNLVGNAFAHTAGGCVQIDVSDGRLCIANSDVIGATVRDTLFLPFNKGEGSSGHGLGLAIVRRLCDRHRIDLRIDSEAGTTVTSLALDGARPAL